jgi:hypothetical protein
MAVDLGVLRINLVANTASFNGPLDKAAQQAKNAARSMQNDLNDIDLSEARGAIHLLGEDIGVRLPRHVQTFIAELPGVGAALQAAFPIAAVIAIGVAIFEATDKLTKHYEQLEKVRDEAVQSGEAIGKMADSIHLSTLKLEDQIATLKKLPTHNGIAIALGEAAQKADQLTASINKALEANGKLIEQQAQSSLGKLTGTSDAQKIANELSDGYKRYQDELAELRQKTALDEAEHNDKELAGDRHKYQEKITELNTFLKQQQEKVNEFRAGRAAALQQTSVSDAGDASTVSEGLGKAEATAQATQEARDLQNALTSLRITTLNASSAFKELSANTSAAVSEVYAKDASELQKFIDKALHAHSKLTNEVKKQAEEQAKAEVDAADHLAGYFERAGKEAEKTLQQDDKNSQAYETIARLQRQINDAQQTRNIQLQIASGHITQEQAAEQLLARFTKERNQALDQANQKLVAAAAALKRLSDQTMGGAVGTDKDKLAFQHATDEYLKAKQNQLQIEKEYDAKIGSEQQKLAVNYQRVIQGMGNSLAQMITTGKSNWQSLAMSAINSIISIGVQEILGMAIHQEIADKKKLTDAKSAFHGAYAATSDIPIIGPALAPIAGATAFAAVMAFEKGGIVPDDAFAMVHKNEMVLPANIARTVLNASKAPESARSGSGPIYSPVINAGLASAKDIDRTMQGHFDKYMRRESRRRGMRF